MIRRLVAAFAIVGGVLVMNAPSPAVGIRREICGLVGLGSQTAQQILLNLGPEAIWYQKTVESVPKCAHAPKPPALGEMIR